MQISNFSKYALLLTCFAFFTLVLKIPGANCQIESKTGKETEANLNVDLDLDSDENNSPNQSELVPETTTQQTLLENTREGKAGKYSSSTLPQVKNVEKSLPPKSKKKLNVLADRNGRKMNRLKSLLDHLLENYDKRIRPGYFDQGPTKIGINVLVKNIASVNEVNMDFQIDFYLRQMWTDSRLAFQNLKVNTSDSDYDNDNDGDSSGSRSSIVLNSRSRAEKDDVEVLGLTHEFLEKIWIPDTFFRNEKSSYPHTSTVPNKFVRLYPDGRIQTSQRLTVTASCNMNLKNYPMDSQISGMSFDTSSRHFVNFPKCFQLELNSRLGFKTSICGLNLGSYGYSTSSIEYHWQGSHNKMMSDVDIDFDAVKIDLQSSFLPQFRVKGHRRSQGNTTVTSTGEYSSLSFEFLFVRSLDFYLSRVYAPSILVVVIAYFALWMGRESNSLLSRARPGLGITSVLTITTIYLSTNTNTAHISYLKALDIYLGLCFLGVFTTLLQTCFVIYLTKRIVAWEKRQEAKKKKEESMKMKMKGRGENETGSKSKSESEFDADTFIINMSDRDGGRNRSRNGHLDAHGNVIVDLGVKDKPQENSSSTTKSQSDTRKRSLYWPSRIDLVCRFLYPLIFTVLNIIYWTHFLNASREAEGCEWITP